MEYLKEYGITDEQIYNIKSFYNDGICEFVSQNREFVTEKLDYLKSENITLLYEILFNNIKIFLEELYVVKEKIEKMKSQNLSNKIINMALIDESIYDKI